MRHAVIMAGGAGTRLWPLSRKMRPKQLLRLFDGASLLELARQRLANVFTPECTWVITSAHYIDQVAEALPDVPRENLIGEPMGRDTANAIGLAAQIIHERDADATMGVFTADHIIRPQDRFDAAIQTGLDAAENNADSLITFGITPQSPHTGYGYVQRGAAVSDNVYRVAEFKEKPDLATAERYVTSGDYYWNSGMFAWRVAAVLAELEKNLPKNAATLADLAANWQKIGHTPEGAAKFESLEKISVDYGIMEKARSVLLVEMNCDWKDLGSWISIASTRAPDSQGNVAIAQRALSVDGGNNIIVTEKEHLVVTLGVSDVVVVHSDDATLVCHRDQVEQIKALAKERETAFGDQYE